MNIEDFCSAVRLAGGKTNIQELTPPWSRVFILRSDGCTIGRASFKNDGLYSVKNYKREYRSDICPTDFIFCNLDRVLAGKSALSSLVLLGFAEVARLEALSDLAEKLKWRDDNPPGMTWNKKKQKMVPICRARLTGKNPRFILRRLVRDYGEV